jgi:hypothetical protein
MILICGYFPFDHFRCCQAALPHSRTDIHQDQIDPVIHAVDLCHCGISDRIHQMIIRARIDKQFKTAASAWDWSSHDHNICHGVSS